MSAVRDSTQRLAALFASRTGIDLGRGNQEPSLERFVLQRSRELELRSLDAYVEMLVSGDSPELRRLINATTIGLSWLFRDAEQLAAIDQLFAELPDRERPLEVWVAGCARGEDVYSLAMLAAARGRRVSILGSDINSDFLAQAGEGTYGAWSCRHVPARLAHHLVDESNGRRTVSPALRRSVRFVRHNLLDASPRPGGAAAWDIVVCRNVLIYFHAAEAAATVARLATALADDGWLFLGANEPWSPARLQPVAVAGRIAFRRGNGAAEPLPPADPPASLRPLALPAASFWSADDEAQRDAVDAHAETPAMLPEVSELMRAAADRHVEGRFAEALALYSQVLAIAPLLNEAHLLLGVTHYMVSDHGAAVQALRAALFLDPDLWPAAFYLALSHDKLGNRSEAARAYRDVLAAADKPQRFSTIVLEQLGVWKADIVQLARARAARDR
ncbi:MAG: methyltransferase, CheR-type [bacterium]|nr:methyltransferase, CheR-type [bacterium]